MCAHRETFVCALRALSLRTRTSLQRRRPHGKRRSICCQLSKRRAMMSLLSSPRLATPATSSLAAPHGASQRHLATSRWTTPRHGTRHRPTSSPRLASLQGSGALTLAPPPSRAAAEGLSSEVAPEPILTRTRTRTRTLTPTRSLNVTLTLALALTLSLTLSLTLTLTLIRSRQRQAHRSSAAAQRRRKSAPRPAQGPIRSQG